MGLFSKAKQIKKQDNAEVLKQIEEEVIIEKEKNEELLKAINDKNLTINLTEEEINDIKLKQEIKVKLGNEFKVMSISDYINLIRVNIIKGTSYFSGVISLPFYIKDEGPNIYCNGCKFLITKEFFDLCINDAIYLVLKEILHLVFGHRNGFSINYNEQDGEYRKTIFSVQKRRLENTVVNSVLLNNPNSYGINKKLIRPSTKLIRDLTSGSEKVSDFGNWGEENTLDFVDDLVSGDKRNYNEKISDYKNEGIKYSIRGKVTNSTLNMNIDRAYLDYIKKSLSKKDIEDQLESLEKELEQQEQTNNPNWDTNESNTGSEKENKDLENTKSDKDAKENDEKSSSDSSLDEEPEEKQSSSNDKSDIEGGSESYDDEQEDDLSEGDSKKDSSSNSSSDMDDEGEEDCDFDNSESPENNTNNDDKKSNSGSFDKAKNFKNDFSNSNDNDFCDEDSQDNEEFNSSEGVEALSFGKNSNNKKNDKNQLKSDEDYYGDQKDIKAKCPQDVKDRIDNLKERAMKENSLNDYGDSVEEIYDDKDIQDFVSDVIDNIDVKELKEKLENILNKYQDKSAEPILNEVKSQLEQEDIDNILDKCLSSVENDTTKEKIKEKMNKENNMGLSDIPIDKTRKAVKDLMSKMNKEQKSKFLQSCQEYRPTPKEIISNIDNICNELSMNNNTAKSLLENSVGISETEMTKELQNIKNSLSDSTEELAGAVNEFNDMLQNLGGYEKLRPRVQTEAKTRLEELEEMYNQELKDKEEQERTENIKRNMEDLGISEEDIEDLYKSLDIEDMLDVSTNSKSNSPTDIFDYLNNNPDKMEEYTDKCDKDLAKQLLRKIKREEKDLLKAKDKEDAEVIKGNNFDVIDNDLQQENNLDNNIDSLESSELVKEFKKLRDDYKSKKESLEKDIKELEDQNKGKVGFNSINEIKNTLEELESFKKVANIDKDYSELTTTQHGQIISDIKQQVQLKDGNVSYSTSEMGKLLDNPQKFEDLYKSSCNWLKTARKWFIVETKNKQFSYQRPNKKMLSQEVILMSKYGKGKDNNVEKVIVFLDTSSSMTNFDKFVAMSIVNSANKIFPKKTSAYEFNSNLKELNVVKGKIVGKIKTTGSTRIDKCLNLALENKKEAGKILYVVISDGGFDWDLVQEHYIKQPKDKMIFIITNSRIAERPENAKVINFLTKTRKNNFRTIVVKSIDKSKSYIEWK